MKRFACLAIVVALFSALSCSLMHAEEIVALTVSNKLVRFDSASPGTITGSVQVTNLQASENLVGIDFRPNTGQLFAVGSTSRVYSIDVTTGVATALGAAAFSPVLSGTRFGIDFNPTVDRIRCCSETGQNLRLNPNDGSVSNTDTVLAFGLFDVNFGGMPHIVATAYTNNNQNATSTALFAIDATLDALVMIGSTISSVSPNGGQVFTVGKLGVDTTDFTGFDISGQTGTPYASLTKTGDTASGLYTINTSTGSATLIGTIGGGEIIVDISAATPVNTYDLVVLRTNNTLMRYDSRTPGVAPAAVTVTGLTGGETLQEIAFRPATGALYAIGSLNNIFTVDPITGAATIISAIPLATPATSFNMGFNFNPVADKMRIVNDANQNLRVNPDGTLFMADTNLTYAVGDTNAAMTPNVVACAYTNHVAGATTTTLFGIDHTLDILVTITPPNNGTLTTVGALGVNAGALTGFDITPGGKAFAAISNSLFQIDMTSGAASPVPTNATNALVGGGVRSLAAVSNMTAPVLQLSAANFNVVEGSAGTVTVTRTGNSSGAVSVDFAVTSGTATAGTHFTAVSGTLTFLSGETSRTISVPTLNDNKLDLFLSANVTLSNAVGATLGAQTSATLTIIDINDLDGDGFSNAIESAAATLPGDASSTPFGGQAAGVAQSVTVTKASAKLNFVKAASDSVSFGGMITNALTTIPAGTTFIAEIGDVNGTPGVIQVFTADSKGKFAPKGLTLGKAKNGLSKFSVTLSKGNFAALLANAGLANKTLSKSAQTLNFNAYFNKISFAATTNIVYSATAGKSGSAVLAK